MIVFVVIVISESLINILLFKTVLLFVFDFFPKVKYMCLIFFYLFIEDILKRKMVVTQSIFHMFCFIECCSKHWIPNNMTGTQILFVTIIFYLIPFYY
jgi:hypothetical protein